MSTFSVPDKADYLVRGFRGKLLFVETWHVGEASRDLEVDCWKERMKRGEATHVEIVDRRRYETKTIYGP